MPVTYLCDNNLICWAPAVCKSVLIKYGQFNRALVHSFGSTEVADPQGSCLFKVDDVSIPNRLRPYNVLPANTHELSVTHYFTSYLPHLLM